MTETDTKPKGDTQFDEFSGEQKRYLEGLVSGLQAVALQPSPPARTRRT
jgi:hypothetical protein